LIFDEDLDDFVDLEDEREYEYLEYEYWFLLDKRIWCGIIKIYWDTESSLYNLQENFTFRLSCFLEAKKVPYHLFLYKP
jgi:hypothetical protein